MATTPRETARDVFMRRLVEVAHNQLAKAGAQGLGMRALARDLGVTPGALYRYVRSRDELLTLLVVNAYTSLGRAAKEGEGAVQREDLEGRWLALWRATRRWALAHRHEYALIYGTPVPGYQAPPETIAPASGVTILLSRIAFALREKIRTHNVGSAGTAPVPGLGEDIARVRRWLMEQGMPGEAPDEMILCVLRAWTELFGCISMELFGHYVGSIEDGGAFLDELARRNFEALDAAARGPARR